jgi:GrpB-like predicted nucleotidyltransferase (UPF0157 family)
MVGLIGRRVALASHDERWHEGFAHEAARLRDAVGDHLAAIEHIGSTAVCGVSAKPIIDIAAGVRRIADAEACIRPLQMLGYMYRGENGISGRYYFVKGDPRSHHLHLLNVESDAWRSHLIFRDYLRMHPVTAREYEDLKKRLALAHETDPKAYTVGKAAFIQRVLKLAAEQG